MKNLQAILVTQFLALLYFTQRAFATYDVELFYNCKIQTAGEYGGRWDCQSSLLLMFDLLLASADSYFVTSSVNDFKLAIGNTTQLVTTNSQFLTPTLLYPSPQNLNISSSVICNGLFKLSRYVSRTVSVSDTDPELVDAIKNGALTHLQEPHCALDYHSDVWIVMGSTVGGVIALLALIGAAVAITNKCKESSLRQPLLAKNNQPREVHPPTTTPGNAV